MATTPGGLPYPALTDSPDVPYWVQQLAQAVESRTPKNVRGLTVTCATADRDASAQNVITTNWGFIPSQVVFTYRTATSGRAPRLTASTANTLTVQFVNADGSANTTQNLTIDIIALA